MNYRWWYRFRAWYHMAVMWFWFIPAVLCLPLVCIGRLAEWLCGILGAAAHKRRAKEDMWSNTVSGRVRRAKYYETMKTIEEMGIED